MSVHSSHWLIDGRVQDRLLFLTSFLTFSSISIIKLNNRSARTNKVPQKPSKCLFCDGDSALIGVECNKIQGSSVSQIYILIKIEELPSAHLLLHSALIGKRFNVEQMLLDAMQLLAPHLLAEVNEFQDIQIGEDVLVAIDDEAFHAL